jgi:hypothetical protein
VDLDAAAVEASQVGALGGSNTAFGDKQHGVVDVAVQRWRTALSEDEAALLTWQLRGRLVQLGYSVDADAGWRPTVSDRVVALTSRLALDGKRVLNLRTPLGRLATKPLEIGLS